MRTFTLTKGYTVVCETKDTRNGFKHEAVLLKNGYSIGKEKCCYLNRTWESFTYETVLKEVIRKVIKEKAEQEELITYIKENIG